MVLRDFFHFKKSTYTAKLSTMSYAQLEEEDKKNCRTRHGGIYSGIRGLLTAKLTGGVSLIAIPIGLRRRDVAEQRLALLHQYQASKGFPKYVESSNDRVIPFVTDWACAGIGNGVADVVLTGSGSGAKTKGVVDQTVSMTADRVYSEADAERKKR